MSQTTTALPVDLRILLAEDNFLLGECMRQALSGMGCDVIGPVGDLDEIMVIAMREKLDAALLDVHLGEENSYPAALELARRGVPIIFTTGRTRLSDLPPLLTNAPVMTKPFSMERLETMVRQTFRSRAGAEGPISATGNAPEV